MHLSAQKFHRIGGKIFRCLATLAFFMFDSATRCQTTSIEQMVNYPDSVILVAAHRGDWRNYPENSLPAIKSCIDRGVDIVEVDVRMTKDSIFVLMHDASINRTTNGRGKVKDMTLAMLRTYRLKDANGKLTGDTIPTLEDALALAKGKIVLNIDKSSPVMPEVLAVVDSMDARQSVILKGGQNADYFREMTSENSGGPLFMPILHYMEPEKAEDFLTRSGTGLAEMILGTDTSYLCRKDGAELFGKHRCRLWYNAMTGGLACGYGENRNAKYSWDFLISRGAFIIQTDFPFQLMQYLIDSGYHEAPQGWKTVDISRLPHEAPDTAKVLQQNGDNHNPNTGKIYYTIKKGDTLWALAKKYHTTVEAICKLNSGLTRNTVLQIGRKIRVK